MWFVFFLCQSGNELFNHILPRLLQNIYLGRKLRSIFYTPTLRSLTKTFKTLFVKIENYCNKFGLTMHKIRNAQVFRWELFWFTSTKSIPEGKLSFLCSVRIRRCMRSENERVKWILQFNTYVIRDPEQKHIQRYFWRSSFMWFAIENRIWTYSEFTFYRRHVAVCFSNISCNSPMFRGVFYQRYSMELFAKIINGWKPFRYLKDFEYTSDVGGPQKTYEAFPNDSEIYEPVWFLIIMLLGTKVLDDLKKHSN